MFTLYICRDPDTPVKITLLPFYGGAKGQTLQITETAGGAVSTNIIFTPIGSIQPEETSLAELENPELPDRHETESEYGQHIKNIHRTALNIIKLQEAAKSGSGKLSGKEGDFYRENMESLNQSAQNLAKIYEAEDDEDDDFIKNRAGLSSWFARKKTNTTTKKDKDKKAEEDRKKVEEERKRKEEEAKKEAERKKEKERQKEKDKEEEEEVGEETEDLDNINRPEEASVAEAKPVGLAVAGIGGVAASKPIATAVVGPGGLAIARPVGTAIAGVSPDQALVPIYAEGFIHPTKPNSSGNKHIHSTEYLHKIISKYHQA